MVTCPSHIDLHVLPVQVRVNRTANLERDSGLPAPDVYRAAGKRRDGRVAPHQSGRHVPHCTVTAEREHQRHTGLGRGSRLSGHFLRRTRDNQRRARAAPLEVPRDAHRIKIAHPPRRGIHN